MSVRRSRNSEKQEAVFITERLGPGNQASRKPHHTALLSGLGSTAASSRKLEGKEDNLIPSAFLS